MKGTLDMEFLKLSTLWCYFGFMVDHFALVYARVFQVIVQVAFHDLVIRVVHEMGDGRRGCVEWFVEL